MTKAIRVFLVDDDVLFLSGIELIINSEDNMEVIGSALNGAEAIQKIRQAQPDVVLMDIQMPKLNGIHAIKTLKTEFPNMKILILTTFNEEEYIIEGLANGANGYLIKGIDFQLLIKTIHDVIKGQYLLPPEVATKLAKYALNSIKNNNKKRLPEFIYSSNTFTKREQDVLELVAARYTNKEIAEKLVLSEGTLKNYLTVIYNKLGVKNRQGAISILKIKEE